MLKEGTWFEAGVNRRTPPTLVFASDDVRLPTLLLLLLLKLLVVVFELAPPPPTPRLPAPPP